MKVFRFIAGAALLLGLCAAPFAAYAQDAATARNQIIASRCKEVRLLLDELQRRDLVSRTNLGREYESIAKLLSAFTQRVRNNNLQSQQFEQLLTQFSDATSQFRSAYVRYDDSLIKLQQTDCQAKPADFDTQLAKTRELRDATTGASTHAAAVTAQYRNLMVQMQAELPDQIKEDAN